MLNKKIVIISQSSLDLFEDNLYLGGPVSYGGSLLNNLGADFTVIPMFKKDFPFIDYYKRKIKNYMPIFSKNTTTFVMNLIENKRYVTPIKKADKFDCSMIPDEAFNAGFIYLSPIINDMPINFIKDIKSKSKAIIAIDPFNNDSGHFSKEEMSYFKELVKYTDIIKLSENELLGLAGKNEFSKAVDFLKNFDNLFLITLGALGTFVFKKELINKIIPTLRMKKIVDATGCGDVFLAGFLYGLSNDYSLEKSVLWGNVCASLSTSSKGPWYMPAKDQVIQSLESFNKRDKFKK